MSEVNEPLRWDSDDEIGLMVREYNKMVVNLEESKKALARTEKESAWRAIAQQVAHEIQKVDQIIPEEWDVQLDMIVTDHAIYK